MKRNDLKRIFKLIPHDKAQRVFLEAVAAKPLKSEVIPITEANGRVLASDIKSDVNIPSVSRAVFDGYAVDHALTLKASGENPIKLRIAGRILAEDSIQKIPVMQTMLVACGAPLPQGATAIIMIERVRLDDDHILITKPIQSGENVARTGEDVAQGMAVLKKGHILRPQDTGLLAGIGMKSVEVYKKPKVGIVSVGDELLKLSKLEPDKIANNFAIIVAGLVKEFGADPQLYGIVPDDLTQIKTIMARALRRSNIVITIAGCSVGPKDFVPDAIEALGKPGIVFHGVQLSPGKVMGAGIIQATPIVMLPGHIVSTFAAFYLLVAPLIHEYSGQENISPIPKIKARLTEDVESKPMARFVRVRLNYLNGEYEATPVFGGSSRLSSLVYSNGFTIVPKRTNLQKGSIVEVVLFGKHELPHIMQASS